MQLEHSFTVPTTARQAFSVLRDIERIAPCMPGATITEIRGEEFDGKVKVKVGPMQVTYQGTAQFVEVDEAGLRATLEAKGKEARGSGTAQATITAELQEQDGQTQVRVVTDLAITGRPAQFGRGVMADVGEKLLGQFAACLSEELAGEPEAVAEPGPERASQVAAAAGGAPQAESTPAPPPVTAPTASSPPRQPDEAIDLLGVAGGPVAKRLGPALALVALVALVVWLARRR